ncbi:3,4-dihydroxy-2-butanone-4-phosphate synthase [Mycolicibacterium vinylchloridicum]|uniref:3,4-dihydroxy-2-butanone-4-phosphate synthase n=1 Tax=Mycolicibacterium vinylchloridicum TaxID=2736928 RepID=UPI0015C7941B|nr:3,4-dihydroxy-2-butanone-4-phosphate synthase [Mycolicibacterium vinylchloridicum]
MSAGNTVERAIIAIGRGDFVVLLHSDSPDSEGDLVLAASHTTARAMAFLIRHCSGFACVAMPGDRLDALEIPMMFPGRADGLSANMAVTVDAVNGTTTGISANDRAATVRALAHPGTRPADLTRPGHVLPLRASTNTLFDHAGRAEAAVDLAAMAGEPPAGLLCEIVNPDGATARRDDLSKIANEHGLVMVSIDEIVRHRRRTTDLVDCISSSTVDTMSGMAEFSVFRDKNSGSEHLSVTYGSVDFRLPVLAYLHQECRAGETFAGLHCDCAATLAAARAAISDSGAGVIVYLRGPRAGIGHVDHTNAAGRGGQPTDDVMTSGAAILAHLGAREVRVLTGRLFDPDTIHARGLVVTEVATLKTAEQSPFPPATDARKHAAHLLAI